MHRLEPACNDTQKTFDIAGVNGAGLGSGARMAVSAAGPSWSSSLNMVSSGAVWASNNLVQPGMSWMSSGVGPSSVTSTLAPIPTTSTSTSTSVIEPARKPRVFNIHQRLRELYMEECRNGRLNANFPAPLKNLKRGSRLLEKLVERENLNTLIVNLYPGNKGYSLSLRLQGKVPTALENQAGRSQGSEPVIETMRWPYSDEELLRCIDREELPAALVDLLETERSTKLFYQGCIIAEIRDSRLTFPLNNFDTHHVLLKPTTQSILNDANMIGTAHNLNAEERLSLESKLIHVTAPPLCLDPNPAVGLLLNNIQAKKHRFSTAPLRRTCRKFSQVTVNRKRKLDQFTAHNTLQLHDFLVKRRGKIAPGKQAKKITEGLFPPPPSVMGEELGPILPPLTAEADVFKYAKQYERPKETSDCSASLVEEYILETERAPGIIYHIKLSVMQRASNSEYLGELYVDKDYKENVRKGASCRFVLGSRLQATRYINQFTEIFTEEGRKSVRITHIVPGQPGRVSLTPGMRERSGPAVQSRAVNALTATGNMVQPSINLVKPSTSNLTTVSQLTHLLKSATVPPNVNVYQIHEQQQPTTLTNSDLQNLLSGVLPDSTLANGPTQSVVPTTQVNQSSNATVHYQPAPSQTVSTPSRPTLSSNPQITALATSLRNSVEQFEMQVANQASQAAAASTSPASAQNPTILSLLNATSPLANQKLVARKTAVPNPRVNAPLGNSINNSGLVVNNTPIRVTGFTNQIVGQAQNATAAAQQPGFTLVPTQANLTIGNQTSSNQTYTLSGLNQQQAQTYTLTSNAGTSQGFTLSAGQNAQTFTVLPNHNFNIPSVQNQTFQINSTGSTGQTFTITTPVVTSQPQTNFTVNPSNPVFTVNIPQSAQVGAKSQTAKAFTIQASGSNFGKTAQPRPVAQRRLSNNSFQQVAANASELNKLLSERSDSRVLTERHIADKSDRDAARLNQVLGEVKVGVGVGVGVGESKLSQALTSGESSGSSLGLSMPGLSALLAGTPSADYPNAGAANSGASSLLDRLSTSATFTSPPSSAFPPQSPAPSPSQNITFQSSGSFGASPNNAFNSTNSPLPNLTSPSLPGFTSPSPKSQVQFPGSSPTTSPLSSPPSSSNTTSSAPVSLNLQGLSLQGLANISSGLQVSIPGIAVPISLSYNVSGNQGVLMTPLTVAATTTTTTSTSAATMVLSNSTSGSGSLLSLPVAQIVGSSNKNVNSRPSGSASISLPQGTAQSIQLVSALQRPNSRSGTNQVQGVKNVQQIAARNVANDQRAAAVKMVATPTSGAGARLLSSSPGSQMLALSPQQFQLLQKHGLQSLNINSNCLTPQKNVISASVITNKHRRRSSAADPNK